MAFTQLGTIEVDLSIKPLKTGFSVLENTDILRAGQGDLVVVAGRPGSGKSALATQVALTVPGHTALISLEMSKEVFEQRTLARELRVPMKELGTVPKAQMDKARQAVESKQVILSDEVVTVEALADQLRELSQKVPLSLIVIDYIQLLTSIKFFNRIQERLDHVMYKLKQLANELNTPFLLACQMNRNFEERREENPNARPIMADLAEASAIERFADAIVILHKPRPDEVECFTLKNRFGESQDFTLDFIGSQFRFVDRGGL